MTAFKKNQEVFNIESWDGKGMFYIRRLVVKSCGKQQATMETLDGKMTKVRFYADRYARELFDVATTDPEAKALELGSAYIAAQLALNEGKIGHPAYHQASVIELAEYFRTAQPSFIWR